MTSLIEQANERLEQLRRAGADMPQEAPQPVKAPEPLVPAQRVEAGNASPPRQVTIDLQLVAAFRIRDFSST